MAGVNTTTTRLINGTAEQVQNSLLRIGDVLFYDWDELEFSTGNTTFGFNKGSNGAPVSVYSMNEQDKTFRLVAHQELVTKLQQSAAQRGHSSISSLSPLTAGYTTLTGPGGTVDHGFDGLFLNDPSRTFSRTQPDGRVEITGIFATYTRNGVPE